MNVNVLPASGTVEDKVFYYPVRIYYEDTDAGGIVYYANYLKFAERARSECLRFLGINQNSALEDDKIGFVVRKCEVEYLASARLDDALVVSCRMVEIGGASAVIKQEIYRDDELLTEISVKVVHMSMNAKRPVRMSTEMREKLQQLCNE